MLNTEDSTMTAQAICFAADQIKNEYLFTLGRMQAPSTLFKPRLSIDGNKWCALYGDNLQDGVAGFGDSPGAAYQDFDVNWCKTLPAPTQGEKTP